MSVGAGLIRLQSNGRILGEDRGKVISFAITGADAAHTDGLLDPDNAEVDGYHIMYPYPWIEGDRYRVELREGPSVEGPAGKWWGVWVTDLLTGVTTFVGEQRVATSIHGNPSRRLGSRARAFTQDPHERTAVTGEIPYDCSQFASSAMGIIDVTGNEGAVRPTSATNNVSSGAQFSWTNGHQTTACFVTVYSDGLGDVQHNLGYWPDPAPVGYK